MCNFPIFQPGLKKNQNERESLVVKLPAAVRNSLRFLMRKEECEEFLSRERQEGNKKDQKKCCLQSERDVAHLHSE